MKNWIKKNEKLITKAWLKIRGKSKRQNRTLVSVEYGFHCAVAKIDRKNGDGYRIIPHPRVGDYDLIIALDSLSTLGRNVPRSNFSTGRSKNNFRKSGNQTHRFGVFRSGINGAITPMRLWDVDLCGDRIPQSGFVKDASKRAIASVAFHALKVSNSKKQPWRSQIEKTSWISLLEKEIRWELADSSHDLQAEKIL